MPPTSVSVAGESDPQVSIVHSAIPEAAEVPIKVLDYGAGHGRLLEGLTAMLGPDVSEQVDYVAWNISDEPSPQCTRIIRSVYGEGQTRWFNDRNSFFQQHETGSLQVAIMCNVFHEIDPTKWLGVFEATGVMSRALHADGCLVIVEDYLMPKGEFAHPFGFTLLDTEALKVLFQAEADNDAVKVVDADGRYTGRIKAHIVPARLLPKVSPESRKKSLELAAGNALEQIEKLRTGKGGFKAGQAHAFWV